MDDRYHPDFATDHLTHGTKTIAREIRTWLDKRSFGGLLANAEDWESWASGCELFKNDFSYCYGGPDSFSTREAEGDLFLIFDGGILYDFLSPNGEAEAEGHGWEWPLTQFCENLGYEVVEVTSYCFSVSKK